VDLELLLRMIAVDVFSFNPTSGAPRVYLPWDLDTVMRLHSLDIGLVSPRFEFHELLLTHPVVRGRFVAILEELRAGPFAQSELSLMLEEARALIEDAVSADSHLDLEAPLATHVEGLISWWQTRRDYLRGVLDPLR
jgi:hypothetical protein